MTYEYKVVRVMPIIHYDNVRRRVIEPEEEFQAVIDSWAADGWEVLTVQNMSAVRPGHSGGCFHADRPDKVLQEQYIIFQRDKYYGEPLPAATTD